MGLGEPDPLQLDGVGAAGAGAVALAGNAVAPCVVLGCINMDLRAEVEGRGLAVGKAARGEFFLAPGGKGACEAIAVALLGVPASMVARIGQDVLGTDVLDRMTQARVDTSCVRRDPAKVTGVAVQLKMRAGGQKTHVICGGANLCVGKGDVREALAQLLPKAAAGPKQRPPPVLLMQMELSVVPMLAAMHAARSLGGGCEIALRGSPLDPTLVPAIVQLLEQGIDYLMFNEFEAPSLLGCKIGYNAALKLTMPLKTVGEARRAAAQILQAYPKVRVLVVTAAAGHVAVQRGETEAEPHTTFAIPERWLKILDPVSTPDAFCGALVAARCRGWPLGGALLWALVAYQLARSVFGAQEAMPRLESLSTFMRMTVLRPLTDHLLSPGSYLAQSELHLAVLDADVKRLMAVLRRPLPELGVLLATTDAFGLTPVERAADAWMLCTSPGPGAPPLEALECLRLVLGAHLMLAAAGHAPPPGTLKSQLVMDVSAGQLLRGDMSVISQAHAETSSGEMLFPLAFGLAQPAKLEGAAAQAMLLLAQGGAEARRRKVPLLGRAASLWARWRTHEETRGWPEEGFELAQHLCMPFLGGAAGASPSPAIAHALLAACTVDGGSFVGLLFAEPEAAMSELATAAGERASLRAEEMPCFSSPGAEQIRGFFFLDAEQIRGLTDERLGAFRLRSFQELRQSELSSWLVEKRVDWEGVVCGEYVDEYAACSHRWETPEHPDPDGVQLRTLRDMLHERPRVRWLWLDYCCAPQSRNGRRTASELAYFRRVLANMDSLYVGCAVFALVDISYASRFWTQMEFWMSMQDCSLNGLSTRSGISASGAGRTLVRGIHSAGEQTIMQMVEMWRDKTPSDAVRILGAPDVQVTSGRDKDIFLPKIAELSGTVAAATVAHAEWRCGVLQARRDRAATLVPAQAPRTRPPPGTNIAADSEQLKMLFAAQAKLGLGHAAPSLTECLAEGYASNSASLAMHCEFWCGDLLASCPPLEPVLAPASDGRERAAIFFSGTFSPVHLGHLEMAKSAKDHLIDLCGYAEVVVYFSPSCDEIEREKMENRDGDLHLVAAGVHARAHMLRLAGCHVDLCEALLYGKNYEGSRAAFAARVPRGWQPFVMVDGDHAKLKHLKEKMIAGMRVFCVERRGRASGACLALKEQAEAVGLGASVFVEAAPAAPGREYSAPRMRKLVQEVRGGAGTSAATAAAMQAARQEFEALLPPKVADHIIATPVLYARIGSAVFDVCIVGSGPIGLLLAVTLAERGQRVLLLDSASADQTADQEAVGEQMGAEDSGDTMSVYGGELAGDVRRQWPEYLVESRARTFGGTSNLWDGWCPRLDPIDHEDRTLSGEVKSDGWGAYLTYEELQAYYDDAERIMEAGAETKREVAREETPLHGLLRDWSAATLLGTFPPQFQPTRLCSRRCPIYGRVRFQDMLKKRLQHQLITTWRGVHVLRVLRDGGSSSIRGVEAIKMTSGAYKPIECMAKRYVLAAGGIETPRLLMNSRDIADLPMYESIGRSFATHPLLRRFATVKFELNGHHKELLRYTALEFEEMEPSQTRGTFHGPLFRWSPRRELLEGERLPNFECLTHPTSSFPEDGLARMSLHYEQPFCLGHHLGLSTSCDKFDMRQPLLTLGISKQEREWLARIQAVIKEDLVGCGIAASVEFPADILAAPADGAAAGAADAQNEAVLGEEGYRMQYLQHHIGATRMSASPEEGVVDGQCRVHGVDNLYVAGTSVFPSGGHGNPTLTALALALRLADHLVPAAVVEKVGDSLGEGEDKVAKMLLGGDGKPDHHASAGSDSDAGQCGTCGCGLL